VTKEIEMSTLQRPRTVMLATVVLVACTLSAAVSVNAEEQIIADEPVLVAEAQVPSLAPVAGPSWDEPRDDEAVGASRAVASVLLAAIAPPSWDETSRYGAVEASRAEAAKYGALAAGTTDETALLAQFRAVELSLSRHLGAEHSMPTPCDIIY
jgi:hypothetical protein